MSKVTNIALGTFTAVSAGLLATTAAEAGCVFNAKGKVVGAFGGQTRSDFDRAGNETATLTNEGFSVGYSSSRGEMAFFDADNRAASRANFKAAFPDGVRQAWFACIKKPWIEGKGPASVFGEKKEPEIRIRIPDRMIRREPAQRKQETTGGNCIRTSCNYILRKHGL